MLSYEDSPSTTLPNHKKSLSNYSKFISVRTTVIRLILLKITLQILYRTVKVGLIYCGEFFEKLI